VLRYAGFTWNEQTLTRLFAEGPDVFLPGTRMPLQRIADREDLGALVAYLRGITAPSPGR
jgi:cytochrome c